MGLVLVIEVNDYNYLPIGKCSGFDSYYQTLPWLPTELEDFDYCCMLGS